MRPPSVLGDAEETVGSPWLFPDDLEQSPPDPEEPPASTGEEPTP